MTAWAKNKKRKVDHQVSRTAGRDHCPEQLKSPRCVTLRASQRLATQDSHLHDKRTRQRLLNRPFKRTRASDLAQLAGVRAAHSVWRPKTKDLAKTASLKLWGTCENRRRQSHWALRLDQPAPRAARRGAMRCPLQLVAVLSHVCSKVKLRSECGDDRTRLWVFHAASLERGRTSASHDESQPHTVKESRSLWLTAARRPISLITAARPTAPPDPDRERHRCAHRAGLRGPCQTHATSRPRQLRR